jgi:hypothetical protein
MTACEGRWQLSQVKAGFVGKSSLPENAKAYRASNGIES